MQHVSKFRMPDSTLEYLTDPVVRKAVDSLLDIGEDTLPNSLEIKELSNYYRARSAALAVKYDTIIAIEQLFSLIWGSDLGLRCNLDSASQVSPEQVFQNLEFWIEYSNRNHNFYAGLGLDHSEDRSVSHITLTCSLEDQSGNELLTGQVAPFAFADKKDDWENWMVYRFPLPFEAHGEWDITQLCRLAADVRDKVKVLLSKLG